MNVEELYDEGLKGVKIKVDYFMDSYLKKRYRKIYDNLSGK